MSRWVRIYIVVSTLALLGCLGAYLFIFVVGKSQRNESPEIVDKFAVSARVVTEKELSAFFNVAPPLNQQSQQTQNLYLLIRSSSTGIRRHIMSANAEYFSPEFMKGKRVSVMGGNHFQIARIDTSRLTEEQRNMLLMSTPQLRVVDAWVK